MSKSSILSILSVIRNFSLEQLLSGMGEISKSLLFTKKRRICFLQKQIGFRKGGKGPTKIRKVVVHLKDSAFFVLKMVSPEKNHFFILLRKVMLDLKILGKLITS